MIFKRPKTDSTKLNTAGNKKLQEEKQLLVTFCFLISHRAFFFLGKKEIFIKSLKQAGRLNSKQTTRTYPWAVNQHYTTPIDTSGSRKASIPTKHKYKANCTYRSVANHNNQEPQI